MSNLKVKFPIKEWSEADRPREKLIDKGKKTLTNAELMAILIGSGNRDESAVGLCKRILNGVDNNLNQLGRMDIQELVKYKGIGEAKAISVVAAMELGRRQRFQETPLNPKILSSADVFSYLQPILGDLMHEEFWVLFLNNSNKILDKKMISSGGHTGTAVDLRLVFKKALEISSTAIILSHNHPSGTLKPSLPDKKMTTNIQKAGNTLNIKVLDHVIITEKSYFSFADEGLL